MTTVWIITDTAAGAAELIAGARALAAGAGVTVFLRGDEQDAAGVARYGADRVFWLAPHAERLWEEDYLPVLAERARIEQPRLILLTTGRRCRDLAARLAALLDAPCVSGARRLAVDGATVSADTMVYGGLAIKSVSTTAPIVLATVAAQTYEAAAADNHGDGAIASLAPAAGGSRVIGRRPRGAQSVNLSDAARVVGVGRGLTEPGDIAIAAELAGKIGAELACTRPIAEFYKWLPEERYLGVSGQVIKPRLYLAVGISGQAQHYYGVRDANIIVSINKDPDAPLNQNADYYIVGDFREVLPALHAALDRQTGLTQ